MLSDGTWVADGFAFYYSDICFGRFNSLACHGSLCMWPKPNHGKHYINIFSLFDFNWINKYLFDKNYHINV